MKSTSPRATVIFDCDSTLIDRESLDELLLRKVRGRKDLAKRIAWIGNQGMEGKISFGKSVQSRLSLAKLTRTEMEEFAEELPLWLTPGMLELIHALHDDQIDIWILSGAPRIFLLPLARELGVSESRVQGVRLLWDKQGRLLGLDPAHSMSISKVDGARHLCEVWQKPSVIVGDGYTDFELQKKGLVEHFIAYTQHRLREFVSGEVPENRIAPNVNVLEQRLFETIGFDPTSK